MFTQLPFQTHITVEITMFWRNHIVGYHLDDLGVGGRVIYIEGVKT